MTAKENKHTQILALNDYKPHLVAIETKKREKKAEIFLYSSFGIISCTQTPRSD